MSDINTLFNEDFIDIEEGVGEIIEKAKKGEYKVEEIPIDMIDSPGFHDRKTYSEESILELAENIKEYGLVHPIVVRKKENGRYERIVGFRRIRAYRALGRDTIPAVVLDIEREKAIALMLSENIHRENLNVYDATFSQVQYITYVLGFSSIDETIKFINRVKNYRLGVIKIDKFSREEKEKALKLEELVKKLTGKGLRGFVEKVRVISVHETIREALRRNNWGFMIAVELDKLARAGLMEELKALVRKIEEENLSFKEIRAEVNSILGKDVQNPVSKINRKLTKNYFKLDEERRKRVDELLRELITLLSI